MMNPPLRLLGAFQQETQEEPEHLLALSGRTMWLAAKMTEHNRQTVIAVDKDARVTFDRSSARRKQTAHKRKLPAWAYYTAGAVAVLERRGLELGGAIMVIAGDEPVGPRYDHALGMTFAAFWYTINDQDYDTATLMTLMDEVRQHYLP